ncbi:hypothetical protein ACFX2J_014674 [Malus domestica]
MPKHRVRESIKSSFGSHINSQKHEELKGTKIDIEEKVNKILKLLKDEDPEEKDDTSVENSKKEPLAELIQDFHKEYQSLYAQYDHLTGVLNKKVRSKQEKDSSSSSSSDTDSKHSSNDRSSKNGVLESDFQKITDGIKHELELAHQEVADLNRRLTATSEEKEALSSECAAALTKIEEMKNIVIDMKTEAEKLDAENSELKQKLEAGEKIEAELNQKVEDLERKRDNLIKEKETALRTIEDGENVTAELRTLIDRLKDEKVTLEQELESVRGEVIHMKQQLQSAEQQVSDLSHNLKAKEEETMKIVEISTEIQQAQNVIQELTTASSQLKEKLGQREVEYSTLSEMHELHEKKTLAQITGLKAAVAELELELESLRDQKREMEVKIESTETEVKQLGEVNAGQEVRISELESISNKREAELSSLMKKHEDSNSESIHLKEQLDQKEKEYSTLSEKHELHESKTSAEIIGLEAVVTGLKLELESLRGQKRDIEIEIENKETHVKQLAEENAGLQAQISELEEKIRTKSLESDQLRAEIVELKDQIVEFEKRLTEKGGEFSSLQEKHDSAVNDASAQITAFVSQVTSLEQELDSLQNEKNQMELQFEREKQELWESLTQLENGKFDLESKIADHQRLLNEQEEICSKLKEECIQLESQFQDTKINCDAAERKVEQVAEDFSKKIESKDEKITDLEQEVEYLKRDLEEKGYELSSLVESSRNIEVKLRLSNQKVRVTEQVLTDKEESFKKAELKFLEEQRALEDRIARLSGVITANNEAYQRNITLISENVNSSLSGIESVINKFVNDYAKYETCILETSQQLHIAKNWIAETNNEKEKLKREVEDLIKQLRDKKEEAFMLGEQFERMRAKASKEEVEKGSVIKAVSQLEKKAADLEKMVEEKKEGMLGLGEEKREAIRQLCIWIEYHQSRYDHLKEVLLKTTPAGGQGRASSSRP